MAGSNLHFPLCGFWGLRIGNSLIKKTFSSPRHSSSWNQTDLRGVRESSVLPQLLYDSPMFSPQLELITTQAIRAGFTGGVVVDYPNSAKAKK